MWIDTLLEFSDAQAVTTTAASTNVVNLGSDRDVGVGNELWVCMTLDVAADDTDANETYVVDLQTDTVEAMSSADNIAQVTIPRGSVAGSKFTVAVPFANQQFLRLNYTTGGTTPSMTISAWLTDQHPAVWAAYPDGVN
jgi:hypothetical protein